MGAQRGSSHPRPSTQSQAAELGRQAMTAALAGHSETFDASAILQVALPRRGRLVSRLGAGSSTATMHAAMQLALQQNGRAAGGSAEEDDACCSASRGTPLAQSGHWVETGRRSTDRHAECTAGPGTSGFKVAAWALALRGHEGKGGSDDDERQSLVLFEAATATDDRTNSRFVQ